MGTARVKGGEVRPLARIDWRGWDEEQNRAERLTIFERSHGMTALDRPVNRPVPRQANCHYLSVDADRRNVYFY